MLVADSVQGKTVGLVGFGTIGLRAALRAAAFNLRVLYHARRPRSSAAKYVASLEELAERSDYLILTCPLTEQTRGLIDMRVLRALGPGGYVIKVARGPVIVQRDLLRALREGAIAGAGLDVFQDEPVVPQELLNRDDVVLNAPYRQSN